MHTLCSSLTTLSLILAGNMLTGEEAIPQALQVDALTAPAEAWSGSEFSITIDFDRNHAAPGALLLSYHDEPVTRIPVHPKESAQTVSLALPLRIGSGTYRLSVEPPTDLALSGDTSREIVIRSRIESHYLDDHQPPTASEQPTLVPLDQKPTPSPAIASIRGNDEIVMVAFHSPTPRPTTLVLRLFIDDILYASDYVPVAADQQSLDYRLSADLRRVAQGRQAVLQVILPLAEAGHKRSLNLNRAGEPLPLPKPMNHGTFIDRHGLAHPWEITHGHECIRDGQPYYPVGGMCFVHFLRETVSVAQPMDEPFAKDVEMLRNFKQHGLNDLYLNLVRPPAWQVNYFFEYLDRIGITYGFQPSGGSGDWMEAYQIISDPTQGAIIGELTGTRITAQIPQKSEIKGFLVVPIGLDKAHLRETGAQTVSFHDTDGKAADAVVFDLDSSESGQTRRIAFDLNAGYPGVDRVFLVPLLRERFHVRDLWSRMDEATAKMDRLAKYSWGSHFHFFVDILVNEEGLYNKSETLRPYFPAINHTFAAWLAQRYGDESRLQQAWGCPDLSFALASTLVPCRIRSQDDLAETLLLIDPASGTIHATELDHSQAWLDFADMIQESTADLKDAVALHLKATIDVPIISKNVMHTGARYQVSRRYRGIDGIGIDTYRNGGLPALNGGGGVPPIIDGSSHTMWQLTTEMGHNFGKGNGGVKFFPDQESVVELCDELHAMGSRGFFFFGLNFFDSIWRNHSMADSPEALAWAGNIAAIYPEKSRSPNGYALIIPGGFNFWWPVNRQSALYDTTQIDFALARTLPDGRWAYVSEFPTAEADIIIMSCPNPPYSRRYAASFTQMLAADRRPIIYLGDRTDLGTIPVIDRHFTEEEIAFPDGSRAKTLDPSDWEVLAEEDGRPWAIRRGNILIISRFMPGYSHTNKRDTQVPYLTEQWLKLIETK